MKTTLTILFISFSSAHGATIWQAADNTLASAAWDSFSYSSATAGERGSQGSAQNLIGTLISSSDLSTEILQSYDTPPGGLLGNPDTYYFHNGGAQWTVDTTLSSNISHVRVSYSLLGFGGGAPSAFGQAPEISGATVINSGSYTTASNTVFFTDLELATSTNQVSAQFGDVVFPMFPGSFRSIDGVQIELFDAVPIPEPSTFLLFALGFSALLRRKR